MSIVRKLGQLETLMEILNQRAKTWNIVTISRVRGNLQPSILKQSLNILQHRHPQLNYRIINIDNNYYFQNSDIQKIPLITVRQKELHDWETIVNQQINEAIDSSKYLLRVILVQFVHHPEINYLITTTHHAIADGLSSLKLHSEILTYYQQINDKTITIPTTITPLPPIETLLPSSSKSIQGKISTIILLLKIAFQTYFSNNKTLKLEKYVPIPQRHCQIIHKQLDVTTTQKLIDQCHQQNTTVYGALCAAMLLTAAQTITNHQQHNIRINSFSHIDMRKRLEPEISQEEMGIFSTLLMEFHTIKPKKSFWELAREIKQQLEQNIKLGDIFKMILLAKPLINFMLDFPRQIAATVSISNAGKLNFSHSYGELELEEISFAGSYPLYAGMFIIHTNTFQGKMFLNFVFSLPALSQETITELVENFLTLIINITNE
jgi:NRPS condensation-like uncharacterized protein